MKKATILLSTLMIILSTPAFAGTSLSSKIFDCSDISPQKFTQFPDPEGSADFTAKSGCVGDGTGTDGCTLTFELVTELSELTGYLKDRVCQNQLNKQKALAQQKQKIVAGAASTNSQMNPAAESATHN